MSLPQSAGGTRVTDFISDMEIGNKDISVNDINKSDP